MEMIFCPNCAKLTGYKRALGFGTFFGVLVTAGLWLLAIPFYPKRCITCGLDKSESVPWHKTWRLAAVLVAGGLVAVILVHAFSSVPAGPITTRVEDLSRAKPVTAQTIARDDWKQPSLDLDAQLTATLGEAPLTAEERAQIYKVIANFALSAKQREKTETLMSARVGTIGFAADGSRQVLVQGPYAAFCGASGNCPMWILVRQGNQLRLAAELFGNAVILRDTFSNGFRDFATASHSSAQEEFFSVYRWNGDKYERVDRYKATFDSDRSSSPAIGDCPM